MTGRLNPRLYALFCLSGFVGVLAEQVFEKMLSVVVGASTPSAAVVLAVYFLGLSVGGYGASVLLEKKISALRGYCLAELGVALCCLWLLLTFDAANHWYSQLIAWGAQNALRLVMARSAVAGVIIFPTTFFLGLSFPFLGSVAAQVQTNATYFLANLYCCNLAGAALCALVAPYLVFPSIGLAGALCICVAADGLVAIYAAWLSRSVICPDRFTEANAGLHLQSRDLIVLGIAFVSGLLFFALEVIWTHLVGVVVGTSVYAFSSMLFVVFLGLAAGSLRISRKTNSSPATPVYGLLFLCAATLLAQTALWPLGPAGIAYLGAHLSGFYSAEMVRLIICLALLLPCTYAFGLIYPSLFQEERFGRPGGGTLLGYMTGVNAIGCVGGALLATFVLIPRFGSEWSLRWFTIVLVACGIAMLRLERKGIRDACIAGALLSALSLGMPAWDIRLLTSGVNVYLGAHGLTAAPREQADPAKPISSRIVFFHEGSYGGMTTVVEYRQDGQPDEHVLFTNGKFQGDDWEEQNAQIAFALIPAIHVRNRNRALVIGCGTGQSAAVLNALDFKTVDIAEISPGILLAARNQFGRINQDVLGSPKVRVHLEDGRNYLLSTGNRYDQITIELNSIWFAGATNLYSREFYEVAKHHLRTGGVFQQWFQLHHIGPHEIESVIGTLRASFPYVSAWLYGGQGVLLATMEPQHIAPDSNAVALEYLRKRGGANSAQHVLDTILSSRLLDSNAVNRLVRTTSPIINTDWNRWIEFSTPRYNSTDVDWFNVNRQRLASVALLAASNR